MNFGKALDMMKEGVKVARKGWNGKGQFVYYVPEGRYAAITDAAKSIAAEDGKVTYRPYLALKTVQGDVATWAPSISDLLAEDWEVVGSKCDGKYEVKSTTVRIDKEHGTVTIVGTDPETIEKAVRVFIKYALSEEEREIMMSNLRGYRQWIDGVGDGEFGTDAEELDYYLGMCRYSAVTYGGFKERMERDPIYQEKLAVATTAAKPELAKEFAIRDFVEHVFHMVRRNGTANRPVSIGFSDDDKGNVKCVSDYIRSELSKRFEGIKFVVYDTSDRSLAKGRKVCVSGQLNLPGF
jgi:hypothetical protein